MLRVAAVPRASAPAFALHDCENAMTAAASASCPPVQHHCTAWMRSLRSASLSLRRRVRRLLLRFPRRRDATMAQARTHCSLEHHASLLCRRTHGAVAYFALRVAVAMRTPPPPPSHSTPPACDDDTRTYVLHHEMQLLLPCHHVLVGQCCSLNKIILFQLSDSRA